MKQPGHLFLAQAIFHKLQKERLLAGFGPQDLGKAGAN
jgi:hypothetical protein